MFETVEDIQAQVTAQVQECGEEDSGADGDPDEEFPTHSDNYGPSGAPAYCVARFKLIRLPWMSVPDLTTMLARDPWRGRMVIAISVVLVILLGRELATLGWSVLVPPETRSASIPADQLQAPPAPDADRIAARSLFGRADGDTGRIMELEAPDTRLNLTLRGIASATDPAASRVLVAGPDGREQVYATGATVPGGATVHRILTDRVLLDRRGTLETLRLPRQSSANAGARVGAATTAAVVDNLRDVAGAEELAEVVRPQPVLADGRLRGYRLYPGRDRQRFAALGLRAGDLVTAIDGTPLNDADAGMESLQALASSEEVTLTIERGGQVENLTIRLDR
jgi:general secretion pathway protein C